MAQQGRLGDNANGRTTKQARDAYNAKDAQKLSAAERLGRVWGVGEPTAAAP